ncbi:MAG: hypothetical protein HC819_16345 [Cyclobacteriaceae bacterium]|nr:hypothetical protein [Cyclobacteriaceae bacterium]
MKTKLLIIPTMIFCLSATSLFAQTDEVVKKKERTNEVGFHSGFTTGVGFSYRKWFGDFGIQLTGLPIKTDDYAFISGGITGMKNFVESNSGNVKAYGYLGSHVYYTYDDWNDYTYVYDDNGNLVEEHNEEDGTTQTNLGAGIGFSFGGVVAYNLMLGYGAYDVFDKFNLFPTIEMGLYFRF